MIGGIAGIAAAAVAVFVSWFKNREDDDDDEDSTTIPKRYQAP